MSKLRRGILIAIEGIDGSGKTTLAHDLTTSLSEQHFSVVLTKEPGGSQVGKVLREILQAQQMPLTPKAEYLLFAADRAQHFEEVIIPALQNNSMVISDRLADSSVVYQGYGRGLDINMIKTVNHWAMNAIEPDLVFYLRISPEKARERLHKRKETLTAFEQEQATFGGVSQLLPRQFDGDQGGRGGGARSDGHLDLRQCRQRNRGGLRQTGPDRARPVGQGQGKGYGYGPSRFDRIS